MRFLDKHRVTHTQFPAKITVFLAYTLFVLSLATLPTAAFSNSNLQPGSNNNTSNRAIVKEFTAELALPDGNPLFVGMKLDCNSRFAEAGMIVFSDQQVETLARAYEVLYGLEVADNLRHMWQNKQTPDAPRLPTFIIVLDIFNQEFNQEFNQQLNQATNQLTHQTDNQNSNGFANERQQKNIQHQQNTQQPIFFSSCGRNLHPPE